MARKLRVQYPGAIYHVMNRGDHLEVIFRDSEDPQLFLRTLDEACTRADWQVHSFCLMSNRRIPTDTAAGREQFAIHMEARRKAEQTDFGTLPRGWCIGSEQFRQELLLQMTTVQGSKCAGPEWKETAEKKAERILAEELERRGWTAQGLEQLRKADPEKLKIARRLRADTTVTFKWITQHLGMGAPGYVSDCLRTAKH